jgi:hypothetical protein
MVPFPHALGGPVSTASISAPSCAINMPRPRWKVNSEMCHLLVLAGKTVLRLLTCLTATPSSMQSSEVANSATSSVKGIWECVKLPSRRALNWSLPIF